MESNPVKEPSLDLNVGTKDGINVNPENINHLFTDYAKTDQNDSNLGTNDNNNTNNNNNSGILPDKEKISSMEDLKNSCTNFTDLNQKYEQKDKGDQLFQWILEKVTPSTKKGLLKWKCQQKRLMIQNATRGDKSMFEMLPDPNHPEKKFLVPAATKDLINSFPKQYQTEIKALVFNKFIQKAQ